MAYSTIFIEELPDDPEKDVIYILGEGKHLWAADMLCPCGCGERLQMSLHHEGRPRWEVTKHSDGTVSLYPSVWRKRGCNSHFFIKQGRIEWCKSNITRK